MTHEYKCLAELINSLLNFTHRDFFLFRNQMGDDATFPTMSYNGYNEYCDELGQFKDCSFCSPFFVRM